MNHSLTCGMYIRLINNALEKHVNNELKKKNMTLSQILALMEIQKAKDSTLSFKDLEKNLALAQSTTVGLICRLQHKNLVHVFQDPKDKRNKIVQLSAAGQKMCLDTQKEMEEAEKILLSDFNKEEREDLFSNLQKIMKSASKL